MAALPLRTIGPSLRPARLMAGPRLSTCDPDLTRVGLASSSRARRGSPPPCGEGPGVGGLPRDDLLRSLQPCPSPTRGEGTLWHPSRPSPALVFLQLRAAPSASGMTGRKRYPWPSAPGSLQPVLVELAGLHDDREVLALVLQQC